MCGIAGLVGGRPRGPEALDAMLDVMRHRGPDGEGAWANEDGSCLLGHRRLAIIDPAGGRQPMVNEDGAVCVTFNGCIYNYQDIARDLRARGHAFRTHSDTEVIVHAYEEWGPDCVRRFNGMWGFAIWDERARTLFCSRDRVGIKPFYYHWSDGEFGFASEIKALLAAGVAAEGDLDGLRQYLTFQFCLGDTTLFKGVRKLPPGHNLTLRFAEPPEVAPYWDIAFEIDTAHTEDYFADRLASLVEDAVRLRLRADVPLGAHLSGGLDSSTIVCLTRMLLGETPIKTFTGAFKEGELFDETRYARLVAEAADATYLDTYLTPEHFADSIETIIWHMDEPAAGPGVFPQFWVSKLASEHVKVVLGGQGGDEVFIGYARYLIAYLEECLKGAIEETAHQARYVATLETIVPSLPALAGYVPMLQGLWREGLFEEPARRYFRLMDRFGGAEGLLAPEFREGVDTERTFEEFHAIFESHGAAAKINRILNFDLKSHLQSLLHVEDRTSMAWGLESRVPLLDHRIIELMASVPPVLKFSNGQMKHLFRKAIRSFAPPEILARKDKMGFPVPLAHWFQTTLRDFVRDVLLSDSARAWGVFDPKALETALDSARPFDRAVWGALCLELWRRRFLTG